MRETQRLPIANPTREAIALALDGVEPIGIDEAEAAYRAAIALLEPVMPERFDRLRRLGTAGLVAASSRFDDVHRLLQALSVDAIPTSAIVDGQDWPGVIFVGCQRLKGEGQHRWFEQMLGRGAVIVTSDCTAGVPVIASRLRVARQRPARRARLARATGAGQQRWSPLPVGYCPAVRLAPGHLPLARQQRGFTVIANDPLTRSPLVVLAPAGGGQVLHGVAHWWQDTNPDLTEIGTRRLVDVPAFATIGREHENVQFGSFSAALAQVSCLIEGLDLALDRAGLDQPASLATAEHDHEGKARGATT